MFLNIFTTTSLFYSLRRCSPVSRPSLWAQPAWPRSTAPRCTPARWRWSSCYLGCVCVHLLCSGGGSEGAAQVRQEAQLRGHLELRPPRQDCQGHLPSVQVQADILLLLSDQSSPQLHVAGQRDEDQPSPGAGLHSGGQELGEGLQDIQRLLLAQGIVSGKCKVLLLSALCCPGSLYLLGLHDAPRAGDGVLHRGAHQRCGQPQAAEHRRVRCQRQDRPDVLQVAD